MPSIWPCYMCNAYWSRNQKHHITQFDCVRPPNDVGFFFLLYLFLFFSRAPISDFHRKSASGLFFFSFVSRPQKDLFSRFYSCPTKQSISNSKWRGTNPHVSIPLRAKFPNSARLYRNIAHEITSLWPCGNFFYISLAAECLWACLMLLVVCGF